jgi:hypothetical protein
MVQRQISLHALITTVDDSLGIIQGRINSSIFALIISDGIGFCK